MNRKAGSHLNPIIYYMKGYVTIALLGNSPERFLNMCNYKKIVIWNLQNKNGTYECCIALKDFWEIKPIVKKTNVHIKVLKKTGVPFFLYNNRKRKLSYISVVIFFMCLFAMSKFCWSIEFEGNQKYTNEVLMNFVKMQGYHHGMALSKIECEQLEKLIRSEYNDINWVSAMIDGTKLIIKVKENTGLLTIEEETIRSCHLIANESGKIVSMITREGVPMVSVGDEVEKGQLLVSGILQLKDDSETIIGEELVKADADVTIERKIPYENQLNRAYKKRIYKKEKQQWFFKIFDYRFEWLPMKINLEQAEVISEEKQVKIFENFYLPFYYGKTKVKLYEEEDAYYTDEEIINKASNELEYYFEKLRKLGVEIIENNVKMLVNEKTVVASGTITIREKIGIQEEIKQEEFTEEITQEYEYN